MIVADCLKSFQIMLEKGSQKFFKPEAETVITDVPDGLFSMTNAEYLVTGNLGALSLTSSAVTVIVVRSFMVSDFATSCTSTINV